MNEITNYMVEGAQAAAPAVGMMGGAYPSNMMPLTDSAFGPVLLVVLVIGAFIVFGFWIWMIVHAIKHEPKDQALWILILMLTNFWGAIIYYFAVKRKMDAKVVSSHSVQIL